MTKTIVCGRCNFRNEITNFIYKLHKDKKIRIKCKHCKKEVVPKSELPPTPGQLRLLQQLGGSIEGIATRKQITVEINKYKRIQNELKQKI